MPQERLQKILAAAGVASRRKAEELISTGHVEVNGKVVTELGTKADPRKDHIRVDGKLLGGPERPVYLMLHKPKGYVTTVSDPEDRPTVMSLVPGVQERVFPVGRLDYLSEGLLLLTNDGELMQKLTHASSHVPKTYEVKVSGRPSEDDIDKLRAGILLPPEPTRAGTRGGTQEGMKRRSETVRTAPAQIELSKDQDNPWYEITLVEGRNRQIRRMFEQIRHHVEKIKRVRYGTLELDIEPGQWRPLSPKEVARLRASIGKPFVVAPPPARRTPEAPQAERRELSAYDIRGLRDRARSEGSEKPKRPLRATGDRTARPAFDKRGPQRQPSTGERGKGGNHSDRPRRDNEGARTRFERGRSEPRVGRMRGDRDRRERPRQEGQRPHQERPQRFERAGEFGTRPTREGVRAGQERKPRFERTGDSRDRPRREGQRQVQRGKPGFERTGEGRDRPPREVERPGQRRPPRFERTGERPRNERDVKPRSNTGPRQDRSGFGKRTPRRDNRPGKRNG